MIKSIINLLLFSLFINIGTFAQGQYSNDSQEDKEKWTDNIVYGGGGTARFGTITVVGASPYAGYRVTERFIPGIQFHYLYVSDRYSGFRDSRYGTGIFSRYFLSESLFAHVESEWMNTNVILPYTFPTERERQWVHSFMVGGGVYYPIGRRSGLMVSALYILNHDPNTSPHGTAPYVIRAGIMF